MPNDPKAYVIWSFEHRAWWRPGSWGYTEHLEDAGRFTKAEAERIVADANIVAVNEALALKCPRCGFASFHPTDIAERYCGACHVFLTD